ncbi:MAG: fasciclin domain-containing protein [Desulfobacterales bacterium]
MVETKKSKFWWLMLALFALFCMTSCGWIDDDDDDDDFVPPLENIIDTLEAEGDFTTLLAALDAADLQDDLQADGEFTVFAPTDAAFEALPPGTVDELLLEKNQSLLIDILLYHVYNGTLLADDLVALDGTAITMLNGEEVRIDVIDDQIILNFGGEGEAVVVTPDIMASNGVIHAIDAVLNPADDTDDIFTTASNLESFDTFEAAVLAAELDDDLAGPGPLTVFAPTDDAFAALPEGTLDFLLQTENQQALIDLLAYHVTDGSLLSIDVAALDGETLLMLNGDSVTIDVVDTKIILNLATDQALVILPDILCSNGVIHGIDTVLTPPANDING